jgi:hypothetical protein
MRIARLPVLVGLILCLGPAAGRAAAAESSLFGAEAELWHPKVGAEFKSSTDLFSGTNIDIKDDLGLDNVKNIPYVKVWVGGRHRLAVSATRIRIDGDTTLEDQIVFDGTTYAVGERISTKLEADIYRAAWEADWISTDRFRLGTILGADYFDVSASVESHTTGIKETQDVKGPLPIVGLQGELQLFWGFSVYGELAGIYGNYHAVDGSLLEAEAGLKFTIAGKASLMAGWRQLNARAEDNDNRFAIKLGGAVVGLGVSF